MFYLCDLFGDGAFLVEMVIFGKHELSVLEHGIHVGSIGRVDIGGGSDGVHAFECVFDFDFEFCLF